MKFRDGSASPVSTFESSILSKVSLRSPHDGSRLLAVPEGYRNSGLTGPRMFETLRTYLVHTHTILGISTPYSTSTILLHDSIPQITTQKVVASLLLLVCERQPRRASHVTRAVIVIWCLLSNEDHDCSRHNRREYADVQHACTCVCSSTQLRRGRGCRRHIELIADHIR